MHRGSTMNEHLRRLQRKAENSIERLGLLYLNNYKRLCKQAIDLAHKKKATYQIIKYYTR